MKKILSVFAAIFCVAAFAAGEFDVKAYGNAKVETTAPGVYKFTAQPGKGWPQVRFGVPKGTVWKNAEIAMTVKKLSPAGKITCGVLLGTVKSDNNAIKGGYIQGMIPPDKAVNLKFPALGDKTPAELRFSLKNPTAEMVFEISNIKFITAETPTATVKPKKKARVKPIPPVMFKGKPFFPLGANRSSRWGHTICLKSVKAVSSARWMSVLSKPAAISAISGRFICRRNIQHFPATKKHILRMDNRQFSPLWIR